MYNFQGWYDMDCVRLTGIDSDKDLPEGRYYEVSQYKGRDHWHVTIMTMKRNSKGEVGSITHNLNPFKGRGVPEALLNVLPIEAQNYFTLDKLIESGNLEAEVNDVYNSG